MFSSLNKSDEVRFDNWNLTYWRAEKIWEIRSKMAPFNGVGDQKQISRDLEDACIVQRVAISQLRSWL